MHRKTLAGTIGALAALTLAASAVAALPKKGGVYEVRREPAQSLVTRITLTVRPTGKTARVAWFCGYGRGPTYLSFPINPDGTFKGVSKQGTVLLWYIQGRFISPTEARVFLSLNTTCAGKGIHTVLELKQ